MRLTTKSRFAVSAMIDLALRVHQGPVSLNDISERHKISLSYLEQIFSQMRQQGLVESTRGPGGGYALSRPAADINVADILSAVENLSEQKYLGAHQQDDISKADMTQDLWETLNSKMMTYMQSVTLRSLADDQQAKRAASRKSP